MVVQNDLLCVCVCVCVYLRAFVTRACMHALTSGVHALTGGVNEQMCALYCVLYIACSILCALTGGVNE